MPRTIDSRWARMRRGFTLVELMVVIALMGVMAAMVIPEMRGTYGDATLRSAGRTLVEMGALASGRAVSFQRDHRLLVDPGTRRFRIERRVRGAGLGAEFVPVKGVPGCEGELGAGITIDVRRPSGSTGSEPSRDAAGMASSLSGASTPLADPVNPAVMAGPADPADPVGAEERGAVPRRSVVFYHDGTAEPAEIVLRDAGGFGLVVRVHPVTSRLSWRELGRRNP